MAGSEPQHTSQIQLTEATGEEEPDIGFKDIEPSNNVTNIYVGKRNFIHQLMDVALLMANVSQLKALMSIPSSDRYYHMILVFIIMSITLQVTFTICMLIIWSLEKKIEDHLTEEHKLQKEDERKKRLADWLDKFGNVIVLLIIVSNVFITGFGVESHEPETPPSGTPAPVPAPKIVNGTK